MVLRLCYFSACNSSRTFTVILDCRYGAHFIVIPLLNVLPSAVCVGDTTALIACGARSVFYRWYCCCWWRWNYWYLLQFFDVECCDYLFYRCWYSVLFVLSIDMGSKLREGYIPSLLLIRWLEFWPLPVLIFMPSIREAVGGILLFDPGGDECRIFWLLRPVITLLPILSFMLWFHYCCCPLLLVFWWLLVLLIWSFYWFGDHSTIWRPCCYSFCNTEPYIDLIGLLGLFCLRLPIDSYYSACHVCQVENSVRWRISCHLITLLWNRPLGIVHLRCRTFVPVEPIFIAIPVDGILLILPLPWCCTMRYRPVVRLFVVVPITVGDTVTFYVGDDWWLHCSCWRCIRTPDDCWVLLPISCLRLHLLPVPLMLQMIERLLRLFSLLIVDHSFLVYIHSFWFVVIPVLLLLLFLLLTNSTVLYLLYDSALFSDIPSVGVCCWWPVRCYRCSVVIDSIAMILLSILLLPVMGILLLYIPHDCSEPYRGYCSCWFTGLLIQVNIPWYFCLLTLRWFNLTLFYDHTVRYTYLLWLIWCDRYWFTTLHLCLILLRYIPFR